MRPKVVASLVVLGIAALPACSSASDVGSSGSSPRSSSTQPTTGSGPAQVRSNKSARITVSPGAGHRQTHFVVAFTAPQQTGTISGTTRRYQVGAATPQKPGCVAIADQAVGASRAGARVHTTLTPVGGHWCTGTYKGRIIETVQPRCAPGKLCPAFVGILHVVGTFEFRVS